MVQYRHNEPYYKLQLSELEEDAVRVLAFEGKEQISRLFHYKLELLSEDAELDPAVILNKKATLLFMRGDEDPLPVHGIISHFEQRGRTPDYVSYYAELVPKMWWLDLNFQSRVFQNMNIEQMITEVLEGAELSGEDFEFKLNETYPDIEFAVQYRETDFNYVNRRLEHYGIYYYFEHRDDNDVIVFSDANDNLPAVETEDDIAYNPNKDPLSEQETISRYIYQGQVVTGKTQLKDYNYQTPSKELIAESQINSENPGTHSDYGDRFSDESEGEFQVRIRDEAMVSRGTVYKGNGDCRPFHAGYKFTMTEHYREDWNQEFLITQVISRGNQRSLFGTFPPGTKVPPTYENYFESMPVDIPFRSQRLSLHPKITGVLNAKVDAAGDGSQAEVDDQGRYKVILPFDLSGNSGGEASCFIRMIQPYAGPNYGMHFPLHKDTEVLLTFVDGNPDLPVISGAVPNPETISPITNANQTKSVIRDNFGNEIVLDATPGDEHIRFHSPHHNSGMALGKSFNIWTTSDDNSVKLGSQIEVGVGTKTEIFGGMATELTLGQVFEMMWGTKLEASLGGTFKYEHAWESTYSAGPIIQSTKMDILSLSEKDQVIGASDGIGLIGGAGEEKGSRSIVNLKPEYLTLSVGPKKVQTIVDYGDGDKYEGQLFKQFLVGKDWQAYLAFIAGIIVSIYNMVPGWFTPEEKEGEEFKPNWAHVSGLITGGIVGIASILYGTIRLAIEKYSDRETRIEPVEHIDPTAKIALAKNGDINISSYQISQQVDVPSARRGKIILGVGEERKEDAIIDLNKMPGSDKQGEITIKVTDKGTENAKIKLDKDGIVLNSGTSLIKIEKNGDISILPKSGANFKIGQNVKVAQGKVEYKQCKIKHDSLEVL